MPVEETCELLLIRHAPARDEGRLAGRRDVPADAGDAEVLARLRHWVGAPERLHSSPALRCRQTCAMLWGDVVPEQDARLWEQDFGAWEGLAFADLPDLGPLSGGALAAHAPPGGESFADLCARVAPALAERARRGGSQIIVAHAGTIRAGLAMALGSAGPALAFTIAPLSLTRLSFQGAHWSIGGVNWC